MNNEIWDESCCVVRTKFEYVSAQNNQKWRCDGMSCQAISPWRLCLRRQKTDLFKLLSWPRILSRSQKFGDYLRSKWKFVSFWKYSATHHSTLPVKNVTPLRNSGHGCNPCKTSIVPFWHDSKNHPSRLGSSSKVCSVFSCVFRVFSYVFKSPENGIIWLSS